MILMSLNLKFNNQYIYAPAEAMKLPRSMTTAFRTLKIFLLLAGKPFSEYINADMYANTAANDFTRKSISSLSFSVLLTDYGCMFLRNSAKQDL